MIANEPTIDDLKNGVDIVEYIGRHTSVKKRGKEYVCNCPIHGEKTPSCYVNESKQLFHCYGCGAGGSVLDFIMAIYSLDEYGAIQQLKSELNIANGAPVPEVKRVLTTDQQVAQALMSNCKLETPSAALVNYGLILPSAYEHEGNLAVPLRTKQALEDVLIINNGRGTLLNSQIGEHWQTVGAYDEHSPSLYLCPDYIDAVYLHKQTGGNRLIIFAANIYRAVERAKREHPEKQIRLALPNTTESEVILETWDGLYTMPSERGHWCEKDRRQEIKGIKKA